MSLGYEVLKEQQLFRKELKERIHWFIFLRWIAVGVALVAGWTARYIGFRIPVGPLGCILFFVLVYNVVFLLVAGRLEKSKSPEARPFVVFAHVQISVDLVALFAVFYFTGGASSPLVLLTLFHIVMAGILLSPLSCYIYSIGVPAALGGLNVLEIADLVPSLPVYFDNALPHIRTCPERWVGFAVFSACVLITAFLVTSVKRSLRKKGRELMKVSRDLDISNAKLNALYEMVKEMGTKSELDELMDSATQKAARIMGVKACSIKLLEENRNKLRFASTFGLSEGYLSKGGIDLNKSPVNLKIIQGSAYAIGSIDEKDYFQYPEDIRKEGIASMLCLPLRVENVILGVFCVYSERVVFFQRSGGCLLFTDDRPHRPGHSELEHRENEILVPDQGRSPVEVSVAYPVQA